MKKSTDYIKGALLILLAVLTFMYFSKNDYDIDSAFETVGKLRIIVLIIYLLFSHVYGLIASVFIGLWLILRK
jgi:hypothetical protein